MISGAIDYVSANADNVEVTNVVQSNSGVWNEVTNKLDATAFSDVSGSFYTNDNPSGFITGVDLSNYYTKDETSGKEELAQAFADIPVGDPEVNAYVTDNSASINGTTDLVQNSSGLWNDVAVYQSNSANYLTAHQDISNKLDESAFADVSGTFLTAINIPESASWEEATQAYEQNSGTYLTAHQSLDGYATEDWVTGQGYLTEVSIPESATWNEVSTTVQTNSSNWDNVSNKLDTTSFSDVSGTFLTAHQDLSDYYTTAEAETLSSMLSGAIDYVSANAGDEFPVSADEAIQYVQTNSGTIDDTVTSYQTNSGTFLTAHQSISADEWNSNYETVTTNSGAWGGSALPISAGPGIKVNLVDNTLVFSNDETVIFNGDVSGQITDFNTNEQINNFEKLNVYYCCNDDGLSLLGGTITTFDTNVLTAQNQISMGGTYTISNGYTCFYNLYYTITNGSAFSCTQSKRYWLAPTATTGEGNVMYNPTSDVEKKKNGYIYKIVGINRIGG